MYITVELEPKDWAEIKQMGERLGTTLNDRTAMSGEKRHTLTGLAGEWAVGHVFKKFSPSHGNRHYDYTLNHKRFEVKTRSGDTFPRPDFDARVLKYVFDFQRCDIYIFCHAVWRGDVITHVILLGWLTKEEFGKLAEARKAAIATAHSSGFRQRGDMMFVENQQLHEDLKRFL